MHVGREESFGIRSFLKAGEARPNRCLWGFTKERKSSRLGLHAAPVWACLSPSPVPVCTGTRAGTQATGCSPAGGRRAPQARG